MSDPPGEAVELGDNNTVILPRFRGLIFDGVIFLVSQAPTMQAVQVFGLPVSGPA